ncbi:hypothetical protein B0H10DRAFT_100362 [Mycena sp. CBHHK59/15]|nr:hypothetical protein B0H10DRAFT_100362 [Mycena sp. CBHHK59/15]
MSEWQEYPNDSRIHSCRWDWCRNTYSTIFELIDHVTQDHVRTAVPCRLGDLSALLRAEEGIGGSISGLSESFDMEFANLSSSLPSPSAMSPITHAPLPFIDFSSPQTTRDRPSKRRRGMGSVSTSPLPVARLTSEKRNSSLTPSRRQNTPSFVMLASLAEATDVISNPELPDLDTMISNSLLPKRTTPRPVGTPKSNSTPRPLNSQSFSGSDESVERHLTQSAEMDPDAEDDDDDDGNAGNSFVLQPSSVAAESSENLYTGELNWVDEPAQSMDMPRSRSQSPSQSTSQSQRSDTTFHPSSPISLAIQRKQSWYQSRPKKSPIFGATQDSPRTSSAPHQNVFPLSSPCLNKQKTTQPQTPSPTTYRSGSLKIHATPKDSGRSQAAPGGNDLPTHAGWSELSLQSTSQLFDFPLQTQAPYRSQSLSQ